MCKRIVALVVATAVVSFPLLAAETPRIPDLVVVISIDQMRADYLPRFAPWFSDGGFARLMNEGAYFTNAAHRHSITQTGPGHATIGSALDPRDHEIAGNYWFDSITERHTYCVDDPHVTPTSPSTERSSPWRLGKRGLGDAVKERYRKSKIIGISMKDRSAILMAGRKANAAYWFWEKPGVFISSSYYEPNPEVLAFNHDVAGFIAKQKVWDLSGFIPADELERVTYDPDSLREFKRDRDGLGLSFPHPIRDVEALMNTPFMDSLTIDFAMHVIRVEKLGTDDGVPDVLFLGPSALDYYGHSYGPDSMEVADGVVRLDRDIERFLTFLDENFAGRFTVALTADHGVQQIPEVAKAQGKDAGRLDFANPSESAATMADLTPVRLAIEKGAAKNLSIEWSEDTPIEDALVRYASASGLYLNWRNVAAHSIDPETARKALRAAVLEIEGVASAFTASELLAAMPPRTDVEEAVRRGFHPGRSPDVVIALEPGYIFSSRNQGTGHGVPVEADMRVPVILLGVGVSKGTCDTPASPVDMTHTLGMILGVEVGAPDAKNLVCSATQ